MLGDSLLDFLQVCASPAILFDIHGRTLFVNAAAGLLDEGSEDDSTVNQVQSALLPAVAGTGTLPSSLYTSRLRHPKKDYTYSRYYQQQQSSQQQQQQQLPPPAEEGHAQHSRSTSSNGAKRPSFPTPTAVAMSPSSSATLSSSSSAMETADPPSSVPEHSGLGSGPGSRSPRPGSSNGRPGSSAGRADAGDYATPTGIEEQQRIFWKITLCPCKRILALAQDTAQDPIPALDSRTVDELRIRKPVIRLSWREQTRFTCLRNAEGEMAERIRNFDWASHPLGRIDHWPQARVEMVAMILSSPVPMTAYLEKESYVLYNDAVSFPSQRQTKLADSHLISCRARYSTSKFSARASTQTRLDGRPSRYGARSGSTSKDLCRTASGASLPSARVSFSSGIASGTAQIAWRKCA